MGRGRGAGRRLIARPSPRERAPRSPRRERRMNKPRESLMRVQFSRIHVLAGALLVLLIAALAVPATAQQGRNPDGSVNPTASAVHERQLLEKLGQIDGRVSIPAQ